MPVCFLLALHAAAALLAPGSPSLRARRAASHAGAALAPESPSTWARRASRVIAMSAAVAEDDDDDDDDFADGDEDSDEPFVEDVRNEDAEDMLFRFTPDGTPKAWALKPHLRVMLDEVRAGSALLLDVRSEAQWAKGHLDIATHCSLAALEAGQADLPLPTDTGSVIYVHSAFADEGKDGVKASLLLRARGYENARYLKEVYEALSAQLQL